MWVLEIRNGIESWQSFAISQIHNFQVDGVFHVAGGEEGVAGTDQVEDQDGDEVKDDVDDHNGNPADHLSANAW